MKFVHTQGVVLRYSNRNEADRLLTVLTPEIGRILVLAKGCRKPKSRFLAFSQLFCYGELILQPYQDIYILNQADVKNTYFDIRNDMDRLSCATYISNLTESVATTGESNIPLFTLLLHGLSYLSYSSRHPLELALIYELKLLDQMGYRPSIGDCMICGGRPSDIVAFLMESGGITYANCSQTAEGISIHYETAYTIQLILDADVDKAFNILMTPQIRQELNLLLPAYIQQKMDLQVKSRAFLNLTP